MARKKGRVVIGVFYYETGTRARGYCMFETDPNQAVWDKVLKKRREIVASKQESGQNETVIITGVDILD